MQVCRYAGKKNRYTDLLVYLFPYLRVYSYFRIIVNNILKRVNAFTA